MALPKYPRMREPWEECDICGFELPKSRVRRDRKGRLVCGACLDEPDRDDYMEEFVPPEEKGYGEPHELVE